MGEEVTTLPSPTGEPVNSPGTVNLTFYVPLTLEVDLHTGIIKSSVVLTPNVSTMGEVFGLTPYTNPERGAEVSVNDPAFKYGRDATNAEMVEAIKILDDNDWPQVELQS